MLRNVAFSILLPPLNKSSVVISVHVHIHLQSTSTSTFSPHPRPHPRDIMSSKREFTNAGVFIGLFFESVLPQYVYDFSSYDLLIRGSSINLRQFKTTVVLSLRYQQSRERLPQLQGRDSMAAQII